MEFWDENYGAGAVEHGENVKLSVPADASVTFYFDYKTGWITDSVSSIVANVSGDFQSEIGCPGDWAPDCLRSWLEDPDGDGVYTFTTLYIPAGDYQAKVALNQTWDENYGLDGAAGGDNIPFSVPADGHEVTFTYDSASHAITITVSDEPSPDYVPPAAAVTEEAPAAEETPAPEGEAEAPRGQPGGPDTVTVAGTIQALLGCANDWAPECDATFLTYDPNDNIWMGTWDLPAGDYEYKAALNGGWDENYGLHAVEHGDNIPLSLAEDTTVTFLFDYATGWITDSVNSVVANVSGSFQDEIGCPGDWAPDCLRTWLQDPDGDGIYEFKTFLIPPGDYEAKVALNQSWEPLNYGLDGVEHGPNIPFTIPAVGHEVTFTYDSVSNMVTVAVSEEPVATAEQIAAMQTVAAAGDLTTAKAHWVTQDTIAWKKTFPEGTVVQLFYSPDAALVLGDTLTGGDAITLTLDDAGLSEDVLAKFPYLTGYSAFKIAESDLALVPDILKGQFAVSAVDAEGKLLDATSIQIPGVLDELYTYSGSLGITYAGEVPSFAVWAPTAKSVTFHLFDNADPATTSTTFPMILDPATGVWSLAGQADWTYKFYLYEVEVYAPSTRKIEHNLVTDPYSVSLSMNSQRSQVVDIFSDASLMPQGWAAMVKPELAAPEDIVLYELHIRDFSVNDETVPEPFRGTYMAFTVSDSNGMKHLRALAQAGLTHIHLLPVFDIASINENKAERVEPDAAELATFPGDSDQQQAIINEIRDQDAFNWGYDPFHYSTPEGSYATNPNGTTRILQFRRMVSSLNDAGLRIVMDVVYNHTNASGESDFSVLDKVVPGYYHRLDENGNVTSSTCCQNTATEHNMMEKLMIDSVVLWAKAYKVDGFRFDLMGHHMVSNMQHVREALDALTLENDGVDGKAIYIYGEGWDFGEVAANARGINATQLNLGGTGIGTFNDRIRDAARGGSPFGDWQFQGFVNGLYTNNNGITGGTEDEQLTRLLHLEDLIRVGLAGNLKDYSLVDGTGATVTGADVDYNGKPAGYTLDPQEQIAYVEAHDNETLFDKIQYAAPADTSTADRARMQWLGLDVAMFSQGVPFFHAGGDMLRSKSEDGNSYNSGDWFNRLDFTYQTNNWAVGLPNQADKWPIIQPLLANPDLQVTPEDIQNTVAHFQEILQIRKSSKLFRLETAQDVMDRLVFYNTGPDQTPGLIVMSISDLGDLADLDPDHEMVVVLFNATPGEITFSDAAFTGQSLELHPVQVNSNDPIVQGASFNSASGTFTVPGLTTAVFVLPE